MLGERTTTYAEDLHIIIANLSGFSVSQIMQLKTPAERTKIILYRIGRFNIGMLWNCYSRPNAAEDSVDRWIPSFPALDKLDQDIALTVSERGIELPVRSRGDVQALIICNTAPLQSFWVKYTHLCQEKRCRCRHEDKKGEEGNVEGYIQGEQSEVESASNPVPVRELKCGDAFIEWLHEWQPTHSYGLSSSKPYPINSMGAHIIRNWYEITCQLPESDKLDRSRYADKNVCLLLKPPIWGGPRSKLRGARLLESSRSEDEEKMYFRFDCPLEYTIRSKAPSRKILNGGPIIPVKREMFSWNVLIESEYDPVVKEKCMTRDLMFFFRSLSVVFLLTMANLFISTTICLVFCFGLFIPFMFKGSVELFPIVESILGYWLVLIVILVGISRWSRVRSFSAWKETLTDNWKPVKKSKLKTIMMQKFGVSPMNEGLEDYLEETIRNRIYNRHIS